MLYINLLAVMNMFLLVLCRCCVPFHFVFLRIHHLCSFPPIFFWSFFFSFSMSSVSPLHSCSRPKICTPVTLSEYSSFALLHNCFALSKWLIPSRSRIRPIQFSLSLLVFAFTRYSYSKIPKLFHLLQFMFPNCVSNCSL